MDSRDKFSGSFKASDGMKGNLNKSPNGPQSGPGFKDYHGGSSDGPPKKLGTTPTSNMGSKGGMANSKLGGRTRAAHNQRG